MDRILVFFLAFMFLGCNSISVSESDLLYLNGYWEISEVEFLDGTKKEYTVNPNIDFIQIKDGEGFRKKVQPKFDGTYSTSNDIELLTLHKMKDGFTLFYKNDFSEWEEKLVQLDSVSFSVVNEDGIKYTYKRFQPISIPK